MATHTVATAPEVCDSFAVAVLVVIASGPFIGVLPVPTKIVVTDYLEPDFNWEKEQLASRNFQFAWQEHQLKFAAADDLVKAIGEAEVVVVNMAAMKSDT